VYLHGFLGNNILWFAKGVHGMSKRARTNTGGAQQRRAKRPIDKHFANVSTAALAATQVNQALLPAAMTYPGTITGLRWQICVQRNAGANSNAEFKWAIVVVPQNTSASAISMGSGASMYDPEQNVLVFGSGCSYNVGQDPLLYTGDTSTMRKLKSGDQLYFVMLGTAVNTHMVSGSVMFFIKS